jgi:uncharacterized RDD family membrane protein YckC
MIRSLEFVGSGQGVYYSREAYAGLFTRLLTIAIDLAALMAAGIVLYTAFSDSARSGGDVDPWFLGGWLGVTYVYLVFVKASPVGTLGFLLAGVKIVNLRGQRPSYLGMTIRLLMVLGPVHPVIDYLWLTGDSNRQTLRDKLVGTYVIRRKAVPSGTARIGLTPYFLFGFAIWFPEVQKRRLNA